VVFRTAHKYIHVAAATTAIHGGLTLLKTTFDASHGRLMETLDTHHWRPGDLGHPPYSQALETLDTHHILKIQETLDTHHILK
jgi:hypothetical protein